MERFVSIGEAAGALGVSVTTLRRWEANGKLIAAYRAGGHRRYDLTKLRPDLYLVPDQLERRTVAYARVSSHDQKNDLERQKQVLELYCAQQGWNFEVVADLGSGMNYRKKGLKQLLLQILDGRVGRQVWNRRAKSLVSLCKASERRQESGAVMPPLSAVGIAALSERPAKPIRLYSESGRP
jgi:excisionase family DNA binding protein